MTAKKKPKSARDYVSSNVYHGKRGMSPQQVERHLAQMKRTLVNAQAKAAVKGGDEG